MRRLSYSIPLLAAGVSLYFVFAFGRDALHILFISRVHGLDDLSFARTVYDLGGLLALGPNGLVSVSAALGAIKLAVAAAFALHLADRVRAAFGSPINHEFLDAAVMLAIASTFLAAAPALLEATPQFLNEHRPVLWLAGLAATLSMIERALDADGQAAGPAFHRQLRTVPVAVRAAPRRGASSLRWDYLRREAGAR